MATFTDDVEAVATFYETFLGTPPFVRDDGIAMFDAAGVTVLVHENYEPDPDDLPPEDHLAFAVEDVDATYGELTDAGLEGYREPGDEDWGRSAYLRDPDGRLLELTEAE